MPTSKRPSYLTFEEYQEKVKNLKTADDVTAFAKDLIAPVLQSMLEGEMTDHLGYTRHDPAGNRSGNSRNGHSKKTLRTSFGPAPIEVPRDRNGTFDPKIVPKHKTTQSDLEEKVIAMYAKGMTTRDINAYLEDIYGIEISSTMISSITDQVMPLLRAWQARPLSSLYPFLYLDGIHFKVRQDGRIVTKCAYIILGVNAQGLKEILGIWVGEAEGAKFWMKVLDEIKQRGVESILIACTDGLTGFDEAIKAIFPEARVQQCIVHQIRNTLKFIPHKEKKAVAEALKAVYTAPSEEAGLEALKAAKEQFSQYALHLQSWEKKWPLLSTFFEYPAEIRKIIYTTNTIEGLNRQFRKVTKTTSVFPHDDALQKLLFLAAEDITKKWTMPIQNWGTIVTQLTILFPEKAQQLIHA